jgi:hypothetical protein
MPVTMSITNRSVDGGCQASGLHPIMVLVGPSPAHSLRKFCLAHTPCNGSWLNMAGTELSILSRQYINRRFGSASQMDQQIKAWLRERYQNMLGANWRFTTSDARIKLKNLYPVPTK